MNEMQNCVPNTTGSVYYWPYTDGSTAATRYREALQEIITVLGPEAGCDLNECEGCRYEMTEALHLAKVALGQASKRPNKPQHKKAKK